MALTGRATLDFRLLDQQTPLAVLSIYIYIYKLERLEAAGANTKSETRWKETPSSRVRRRSRACPFFFLCMPRLHRSMLSFNASHQLVVVKLRYLLCSCRRCLFVLCIEVTEDALKKPCASFPSVCLVCLPSSIYRSMHQLLFVVGSFMFSNEQKTIRKTAKKKKKLLATIIPQEVKLFCLENWCGTLEWFYLHKENETSICAAVSKLSRTTQGSWRGMLHASDRCLARRPAILSKIRTMFFAFKNTF